MKKLFLLGCLSLTLFACLSNRTKDYNIKTINFETSGCLGTCPVFSLSIHADRSATYNAISFNDDTGLFAGVIDNASYDSIIQTINDIKITTLKDNYSVGWTDDQTATLEVEFVRGPSKKIVDYGARGTPGLKNLYNQLFNLRKTQHWKKIN